MKTIKILPQNIPNQQQAIVIQLSDNDLFYMKAKKLVAEKLKGVPQDEFVFFSKFRNCVIHEDDRVGRLSQPKDTPEINLYLASELLKRQTQQPISYVPQQTGTLDKSDKYEKDLKRLNEENLKLENQMKIQQADHMDQIAEYQKSLEELQIEIDEQKQKYEQRIKIEEDHKSEAIEKYKVEMNIVNKMKLEQIKKEKDFEDLQYKLKEMTMDKDDCEKQLNQLMLNSKKTQSAINDSVYQRTVSDLDKLKKQLQDEQFECRKEKDKNQQLQQQIQQLQSQLNQRTEDLQVSRSNAQEEIEQLKQQILNTQQKVQKAQEEIKSYKNDKEALKANLAQLRDENTVLSSSLQAEENRTKNFQKLIEELKGEIQEKEQTIQNLKASKEKSLEQLTEKNDLWRSEKEQLELENRKTRDSLKKAQQKIAELESVLDDSNQKIAQMNANIQSLVNQSQALKKDAENQIEKVMRELDKEKERANQEALKKNQLAKRIKQNQVRKVGDGRIIGATESLLRSMNNPFDFLQSENIMTDDYMAEVSILRIDPNKALESLIKNQSTELMEFINQEQVGRWNFKKSIAINGDGSKRKAFLVQVMASDGDRYTNKFFLIKELVGYERISSIEKAIFVAQNQLIARVLAQLYQNKLMKASSDRPPCAFQYPEPFLLRTDSNIYIAEPLIKGNFFKFNGEGESGEKDQRVTAFLNAFTLFTYQATQQMLMVSHIQGVFDGAEFILCDPVLSSPEGILGDEDLGEAHILGFQDKHKENPKGYGKQFLSTLGIKV